MKNKSCKECVWFNRCQPEVGICYYFEPAEQSDDSAISDYEADLRERNDWYLDQIDEQNA